MIISNTQTDYYRHFIANFRPRVDHNLFLIFQLFGRRKYFRSRIVQYHSKQARIFLYKCIDSKMEKGQEKGKATQELGAVLL